MEKMETDSIEKAAMLSFLESYNTVCYLGDKYLFRLDPDIECALRINHAGRKIVVENGGSGSSGGSRSLPPSLWPTILERAYEKSDHIPGHTYESWSADKKTKNAMGLYYLLREGPVLFAGRVNTVVTTDDSYINNNLKNAKNSKNVSDITTDCHEE